MFRAGKEILLLREKIKEGKYYSINIVMRFSTNFLLKL